MSFYLEGASLDECFNEILINGVNEKKVTEIKYEPGMSYTDYIEKCSYTKIKPPTPPNPNTIKIGFWAISRDNINDKLPFPEENSSRLTLDEKIKFIYHLKDVENKSKSITYLGFSECRICKKPNGCSEFTYTKNNKKYIFPFGYRHYIEDHNVAVDEEFYKVVLNS